MKKLNIKTGLALIVAFALVGCNSNKGDAPVTPTQRPSSEGSGSSEGSEAKTPGGVDARINIELPDAPGSAGAACTSDDDCALLPTNGCLGCIGEKGSHKVVTSGEAQAYRNSDAGKKCFGEWQEFQKSLQSMSDEQKKNFKPKTSEDPACKAFNKAACQNGQCVGKLLSPEQLHSEAKARWEKAQGQAGNQAGGAQGPQGAPSVQGRPQAGAPAGGPQGSMR